jgi:hypothetical protein
MQIKPQNQPITYLLWHYVCRVVGGDAAASIYPPIAIGNVQLIIETSFRHFFLRIAETID